jgi:hypothetical protein
VCAAQARRWPIASTIDGNVQSGTQIGDFPVWQKLPKVTEYLWESGLTRAHSLAEPLDGSLNASSAMRDAQRLETHLDDTEYAEHHGSIDVTHMGDAESLALHLSEPRAQHNATFGTAVILQWEGIAAVGHKDGRYRIGTFGRFCDIELKCLSFLPHGNGTADRLGQQTVAKKDVVQLFFE